MNKESTNNQTPDLCAVESTALLGLIDSTRQRGNTTGLIQAVKATGGTIITHDQYVADQINKIHPCAVPEYDLHKVDKTKPVYFDNSFLYTIFKKRKSLSDRMI